MTYVRKFVQSQNSIGAFKLMSTNQSALAGHPLSRGERNSINHPYLVDGVRGSRSPDGGCGVDVDPTEKMC